MMRPAFSALAAALGEAADGPAAEVLWSGLHGMSRSSVPGGCGPSTGLTESLNSRHASAGDGCALAVP